MVLFHKFSNREAFVHQMHINLICKHMSIVWQRLLAQMWQDAGSMGGSTPAGGATDQVRDSSSVCTDVYAHASRVAGSAVCGQMPAAWEAAHPQLARLVRWAPLCIIVQNVIRVKLLCIKCTKV
jgi:hypothetical protein